MNEEIRTQNFDQEFLEGFKTVAEDTRQEDIWYKKIYPQIPHDSADFVLDLVELRAKTHGVDLDEEALETLAQEYDGLRRVIGLEDDPDVDHIALIDWFLKNKGLFAPVTKPQASEIIQPPAEISPKVTELSISQPIFEQNPVVADEAPAHQQAAILEIIPKDVNKSEPESITEQTEQVPTVTVPEATILSSPVEIPVESEVTTSNRFRNFFSKIFRSKTPKESTEPVIDTSPTHRQKLRETINQLKPIETTTQNGAQEHLFPQASLQPVEKSKLFLSLTRGEFLKLGGAFLGTAFLAATSKAIYEQSKNSLLATKALAKVAEIVPNSSANPLTPFVEQALIKRSEREINNNPAIDNELNQYRVNFLITSLGSDFIRGMSVPQPYASETVVSYNTKTNTFDLISLDNIRAPEIEKYLTKQGKKVEPTKIERAYEIGGFDLARQTLEDATGLIIDFQINAGDQFIFGLVEGLGGIEINLDSSLPLYTAPMPIDHNPPSGPEIFPTGSQILEGRKALVFMKGQSDYRKIDPKADKDPREDRVHRKLLIIEAIINKLSQSQSFEQWRYIKGLLKTDFDSKLLAFRGSASEIPKVNQKIVVGDQTLRAGDGGVENVQITQSNITQQDRAKGVYQNLDIEVPLHANPYSEDLVNDYWGSVRQLVKSKLSSQ